MRQKRVPNKPTKASGWMVASIIIFIIGIGALAYSVFFGQRVESKLETVVILREVGKYTDLPNPDEGTVDVALKAIESDILVGEVPSRVQLFRSRMVEGLSIDYVYGEKKLVSGLPRLESPEINLFDGNLHHITYSFKKGEGQALYFDGQKLAEGSFDPATRLSITGFMVKQPENEIDKELGVEVSVYDRAMGWEQE